MIGRLSDLPTRQRIAWRLLSAIWLSALGDRAGAEEHALLACESGLRLVAWSRRARIRGTA